MAVRQCSVCEELMQEGYVVEADAQYDYYCNDKCISEHFTPKDIKELTEDEAIIFTEWHSVEMDAEDFSYLLNKLQSEPTPHEIADIFDILNREDESHYAPMGVINHFIDYLNSQD